jgi:alpha-L-rhamnosidase
LAAISNVTFERVKNPLSVSVQNPRISWNLASDENGVYQRAYQVLVTTGNGTITWDSGVIESSLSVDIVYHGAPLASAARYKAQISIWDTKGAMSQSEWQWFETAFFCLDDWKAQWIEPDPLPQLPENPLDTANKIWLENLNKLMGEEKTEMILEDELLNSLPLEPYDPPVRLRREFSAKGIAKRARLFMTAHGVYDCLINGKRVSGTVLMPGFTTYDKRIKYQVYDVSDLIQKGENAICATVADGWYKGKIALGRGCEYGEVPGLLLQLELEFENGEKDVVCSDKTWSYSYDGPVRESDLFLGETIDMRRNDGDPSLHGYNDVQWKPVMVKGSAKGTLEAQVDPLVKVIAEFAAEKLWTAPNGDTLVDFGQNMAGFLRVAIKDGISGETVTFEHFEELGPDGNYFYPFEGTNKSQTDAFICSGAETEIFEPRFTYHGFRYARVKGGRNWCKGQFTALAISTDNPVTGRFCCSDKNLNKLQSNIYWSQRSNNIAIPTDCPTREKAGWTGDVFVYAPTALLNQDMTAFYEDWLKSVRCEQLENGHVLNTAPLIKSYIQQSMSGSLGWGDAILALPWLLYERCADERVLLDNYEAMGKWMSAMRKAADELPGAGVTLGLPVDLGSMSERQLDNQHYLVNTGFHFGDWLVPSVKGPDGASDAVASAFLTMNVVGTCLLAADAELYARVSKKLGFHEVAQEHSDYAKRVKEAFFEEHVNGKGLLNIEMQGNYILALVHHMVLKDIEPLFAKRLNEMVIENGYRLDTGFMSVAYILDALCDYGFSATAWKVLWQTKCPSWLYEVSHNATTIWENWDAIKEDGSVAGCSFNHYAFGCVGDFMFRRLLGIRNAGIGYDKILVSPEYDSGLAWAAGHYDSVYGRIQARWEKKDKDVAISLSLPANTSAELKLPDGSLRELENGVYEITVPLVDRNRTFASPLKENWDALNMPGILN